MMKFQVTESSNLLHCVCCKTPKKRNKNKITYIGIHYKNYIVLELHERNISLHYVASDRQKFCNYLETNCNLEKCQFYEPSFSLLLINMNVNRNKQNRE